MPGMMCKCVTKEGVQEMQNLGLWGKICDRPLPHRPYWTCSIRFLSIMTTFFKPGGQITEQRETHWACQLLGALCNTRQSAPLTVNFCKTALRRG